MIIGNGIINGFRQAALIVAVIGAAATASFPAAAQEASLPLTTKQCSKAQDVAYSIMKHFAVSGEMAASFRSFRISKCDLNTDWNTVTPIDEKAFGEFRLKLIAIRTPDKPSKKPGKERAPR